MTIERDEAREERIQNEAIVDAYGPEEQALGWYCYLEDRITFPFKARCISSRTISPLRVVEVVEVLEMAGEDDRHHSVWGSHYGRDAGAT